MRNTKEINATNFKDVVRRKKIVLEELEKIFEEIDRSQRWLVESTEYTGNMVQDTDWRGRPVFEKEDGSTTTEDTGKPYMTKETRKVIKKVEELDEYDQDRYAVLQEIKEALADLA